MPGKPRGLGRCVTWVVSVGTWLVGAPDLSAATFFVDTTNQTGPGSLHQALLDSQTNAEPDTIVLTNVTGTIDVPLPLLTLHNVSLVGPGPGQLTLQLPATADEWDSSATTLTGTTGLHGLRITGGGVANTGDLLIENCEFTRASVGLTEGPYRDSFFGVTRPQGGHADIGAVEFAWPSNAFVLTLQVNGPGRVTLSNSSNIIEGVMFSSVSVHPADGPLLLTAIPSVDHAVYWGGDGSGSANPLFIRMDLDRRQRTLVPAEGGRRNGPSPSAFLNAIS